MSVVKLSTPITDEMVLGLKAGDELNISGIIYTARDTAHKKMKQTLDAGEPLPFDIKGQIIYYVGPTPAKPGEVIGSAGPTTSLRMDSYTPELLSLGLKGMIGKGYRNQAVKDALIKYKAFYSIAIGGAAALIARQIKQVEIVAYPELGTEAIDRLVVEDFPVVLVNDCYGADWFEQGVNEYRTLLASQAAENR